MIGYGLIPGKTDIKEGVIKFSGMYGIKLNLSEIESIQLIEKIPSIKSRTNGMSLLEVKKGFFDLEGYGKSRLLINSSAPPFLMITTKNQEMVICNLKDPEETKRIFEEIQAGI
jgi:hypothetical protein